MSNQSQKRSIKNLIKKYKSNEKFRNQIGLYGGAIINSLFVIIQLYGGIKYQSVWFTALAIYYAVLSVVKFYIGTSINKTGKEGWAAFRRAGFIMTILNLALIIMISILITNPSIAIHKYSPIITAVIALWTIGSAIAAVYAATRTNKKNNPLPLADRLIQLITSAVSLLMLQTAMIASISTPQIETAQQAIEEFGSITNVPTEMSTWFSELFQILATSNSITGGLVAIFTSGVILYMITKGTLEKKKTARH